MDVVFFEVIEVIRGGWSCLVRYLMGVFRGRRGYYGDIIVRGRFCLFFFWNVVFWCRVEGAIDVI